MTWIHSYWIRSASSITDLSTYVRPGENLDEILSTFYEKISTPVLTDLSVDFGELSVYDLYPNPLPDLFCRQPGDRGGPLPAGWQR